MSAPFALSRRRIATPSLIDDATYTLRPSRVIARSTGPAIERPRAHPSAPPLAMQPASPAACESPAGPWLNAATALLRMPATST